jgi:hypothetical protein
VLSGRLCSSCSVFKHNYPQEAACTGCGRVLAVKAGFCRLCWRQASLESMDAGGLPRGAVTVLEPGLRLGHHQLFFDRMKLRRPHSPVRQYDRRGRPPKPVPSPAPRPAFVGMQLRLFQAARDFTRFDERQHSEPVNPWLVWGHSVAHRLGESRGWTRGVRLGVQRGLIIVLSHQGEGDTIAYTEMFPALRALNIGVERVAEVLDEMGILVDDRVPSFEAWIERKLGGLAPGIAGEVEAWLRMLHDGSTCTPAHNEATAWNYLNASHPALVAWSARHDHLREVTRDDVVALLATLHGSRRENSLVGLRSLFAFCKKRGMVFVNPTNRIKVGRHAYGVLVPLRPGEVDQATAMATGPAVRLILVLAAVHAARSAAIRALLLDDVDLGNHRLVVAGRARPLDDLTRRILVAWLLHRRERWPNTANPHLIVNQQTALELAPVSAVWLRHAFHGLTASLEQLRMDRQLEEALVYGPDPLHLAVVFGVSEKTAVRYAAAARQLLATPIEGQQGTP